MEVGPDGTVWLIHEDGGIVSFDGESSVRYLAEMPVIDLAVDTDGRVWAYADDQRRRKADIYLVGRETAAAAD